MKLKYARPLSIAILTACCGAVQATDHSAALVQEYIKASFLPGENQDLSRLVQDETLQACNKYRDKPPADVMEQIIQRESQNIQYPADGKLMGDWQEGEKYFKMGFAYRIGKVEPDDPNKDRGGNCYACHSGDAKEVAYGTIGAHLTGYGKKRGHNEDAIKYTYHKIYNAQSIIACSQMPRLGHNGILTPEKIAHITAYLLDPASPINK
jgi:L-cysteine S-thiosulfotransferase